MVRQLFPSWRDEQAKHHFPFEVAEDPKTTDGRALPKDVVLDAMLHPPNSGGHYYLQAIDIFPAEVTFHINDLYFRRVASGTWSRQLKDTTLIPLFGERERAAGVLITSPAAVASLQAAWGSGTHQFGAGSTRFALSTWENAATSLASGIISDGVDISSGGDLYLVADRGTRFECGSHDGHDTLKLHTVGEALSRRDLCGVSFQPDQYIEQVIFQQGERTVVHDIATHGQPLMLIRGKETSRPSLRMSTNPSGVHYEYFAETVDR